MSIKIYNKQEYEKKFGKPNQEKVWDKISELWKDFRVREIPIVKEFLEEIGLRFDNPEKCKIVDLGCGSGRNMVSGFEFYEVDFSDEQLKHAERKVREEGIKAKFFKFKADDLPFEDNFFDAGLFIATLHCLESENERKNSLKEFYRVLKKDAEAVITVWNSEDERFEGKGKEVYMEWKVNGKGNMRYYYLYDKEELLGLLKKVGFKIERIYGERKKDRFSRKNLIVRVKK